MAGRPSQEELELEPLLHQVDPLQSQTDQMAANADKTDYRDDDKLDVETAERRSPSQASQHSLHISPEERRLVRKLDSLILPIACILYLFACEPARVSSLLP